MDEMRERDEVTAADIARLANVGRAAVSNWQRRYRDFPRPVGGRSTSPTFDRTNVEAWLQANGKLVDDAQYARRIELRSGSGPAELANVAASLLPSGVTDLVLDPACGPGLMLAAAARRLGPSVAYAGQDTDRSTVETAIRVLSDAGARAVELVEGSPLANDGLVRYRGAADAVLCLPPAKSTQLSDDATLELPWEFGPPSLTDPYLAWLQICYTYLKPGGTAVVPVPAAASSRSSGRRIRAEIVRAGALRQLVALPSRFGTYYPVPWHIWILRRPADRPVYTVRLVDLSDVDNDRVPTTDSGWRAVYHDSALTRDVASIELLDEDVLLVPARHVEPPVRDVGSEYERLRARLVKAAASLDVELPSFRRGGQSAELPMTSVMALVRLGAIDLVDRLSTPQAGDVLVPAGLDRFDASVVGAQPPDRAPGDVLLRCNPDAIDPYFLACYLRSETNRREAASTTSGSSRLDVRRARIPRLPLADQRRYGEIFRRLSGVTDRVESLASLAADAVQTAVYGLTSGVFDADDTRDRPGRRR